MRIGIDARFFGGEQSKGLGRYTQKLIEHLLSIDTEHTYVIFLQEEAYDDWEYKRDNVEIVKAPYPWYSLTEQLLMPLLIYKQKVNLMHFPHFNVPLLYRGPFIVTIHDLIISRFPTSRATTLGPLTYKLKQFGYNRVISHAAHRAKKIITVSDYSKKDIIDFFHIKKEMISITYEAVDGFNHADLSDEDVKKILIKNKISKPYLLYIGNAYPHKNLEVLLKMMSQLKKEGRQSFKLVFVGKEDYFYLNIQQEAWALDVDDQIIFTGFVPDNELAALYKGSFAYIFPSKYEGFGLPPLEAMYYGTPVISSNSSCLPEVLGDAALYFDFDDVSGIINQIFSLEESSRLREELIINGRKQIKRYSWRKMAKQTIKIYESVLAESKTKITS
ncbi:MAG: glycosyltransferase family 1 protein [bacterium]|nr:glycosyltransferase family 1 protein [bacterium]